MRTLFRAIFGSFTAKRARVIADALRTEHAIDLHAHPGHVCHDEACQVEDAQTRALSDRMHEQSHRLHVLQWQADRFAAKVSEEPTVTRVIVPMRSARPS